MTSNGGMDGFLYNDTSDGAVITVYGNVCKCNN